MSLNRSRCSQNIVIKINPVEQCLNQTDTDQTLTPPIVHQNDIHRFIQDNLINSAINYNNNNNTTIATAANNNSKNNEEQKFFNSLNNLNDQNEIVSKKCIRINHYLLIDSNNQNESFGQAINIKNNSRYLWKKFPEKDYMKKLEPYSIINSSQIHNIKEIIFEQNLIENNNNTAEKRSVFVIFDLHYGDLHSYMKEKKRLEESEAKIIFKQIVEIVDAFHENGIIIRDIKLKKFVFLDEKKTRIGLTNLEDCLVLDEDAKDDFIKSQQGCPAYVSPEVLNQNQASYSGFLSDSWSLGIILYTLLIGRYPFHHPNISNMFAKITRGKFPIPASNSISTEAKFLLRSLIRVKPEERLLPSEILTHNWLKQADDQPNKFYINNLENKFTFSNFKPQLGISLSAPSEFGSLSSSSSINDSNTFMKNKKLNDDDERLVPEFKTN